MFLTDTSIKRPVFAIALSLIIILVGLMSFRLLSLQQYPEVNKPNLTVRTTYRGASPMVVESKVTDKLEQSLSAVSGLDYMTSESSNGMSNIVLHFQPGRSLSEAASDVRERIAQVRNQLPDDVDEPIVLKKEQHEQAFMFVTISSGTISELDLYDYADRNLKGLLETIPGVADVMVYGNPYTMRIELDTQRLYAYNLAVSDILGKLKESGSDTPAGNIIKGDRYISIMTLSALNTPEAMGNLVIKVDDGHIIHLRDVAEISLGKDPSGEAWIPRMNSEPATALALSKTSNGNLLAISARVHTLVSEFEKNLPDGMKIQISIDFSTFVDASLKAVQTTIIEAVVLVLLIIFLFLRSARAAIIPLMTIPVSLIGALAFMYAFGCSINMLTLLAMVLAVGLVVDDAIVVLENIHRHIEKGKSPLEAALIGSKEISFAIIAMTLTLTAVYAPIAFVEGLTGQLFSEFAVTLAGAVLVSGFVALTLSPMMCAHLLKPHGEEKEKPWAQKVQGILDAVDHAYHRAIHKALARPSLILGTFLGTLALGIFLYTIVPEELAPQEDQGFVLAVAQGPEGMKPDVMEKYAIEMETTMRGIPEIESMWTTAQKGQVFGAAILTDWSARSKSQSQIMGELMPAFTSMPGVRAFTFPFPTVLSGGQGGVSIAIKTPHSYEELEKVADTIASKLRESGLYKSIYHDLQLGVPQLDIDIDRDKAALSFVSIKDISDTLETLLGGRSPTTFEKNGKHYDVIVQAGQSDRKGFEGIKQLYVRSEESPDQPDLVRLDNFIQIQEVATPATLKHFGKMRTAVLQGELAEGVSLGEALDKSDTIIAEHLPSDMQVDYAGHLREFLQSSGDMILIFLTALLFIYLVLSIQFNSFVDPLLIMLTVPLSITGALIALYLSGCTQNVFSQVGMVTLVGLITKHGILIVDFANKKMQEGLSPTEAAISAASLRLRPILMTTGAMVLGAIPLAIAHGAGSESRHQIGWVLVGGLLFGTFLTLFVLPYAYLRVKGWLHKTERSA